MGFYINENDVELKQHLNLSNSAWIVINDDIHNFSLNTEKPSFSGFLNRIFFNFYQYANASISERLLEVNDKVSNLYSNKDFINYTANDKNLFVSKILQSYENDLKKASANHIKGDGKKFRINKQNLEILKDSPESSYYSNSIGHYLKALFEEYALLPNYKRESIYFHDFVKSINLAISEAKKLQLSLYSKSDNLGTILPGRKFYLSPYKIIQDTSKSYNYVVGISEEILNGSSISTKQTASFRLSHIQKLNIMQSLHSFISKANQKSIEEDIINKSPQFVTGQIQDIIIKFTNRGLEQFQRLIYMRPNHYEIIDNDTYLFHCTETQALNYFFKFGKNAAILKPDYLSVKFKNLYLDAFNLYNNLDY